MLRTYCIVLLAVVGVAACADVPPNTPNAFGGSGHGLDHGMSNGCSGQLLLNARRVP